jgi:hypothetical protein
VIRQEGACVKEARCKYFGRQVLLNNRKHGPRRTDQFYAIPFHADLMLKHVKGQHAVKWAKYVALSSGKQDSFFDSVQPHADTMYHYIDMEGDEINLVMSTEIVDVIIDEMLFWPKDKLDIVDDNYLAGVGNHNQKIEKLHCGALQVFKLNENNDGYTVNINRVVCFKLTI